MSRRRLLGLAVLAATIALPTLATAQTPAANLPERLRTGGTITVGLNPIYPPMEYRNPGNNQLVGADVDLAAELFKRLGLRVAVQEFAFAQLIPSLTTERIDVIWSGMSDLPARREAMDFVNYMRSGAQFVTLARRAAEFPDAMALCGKRVGTARTTSFPKGIEDWSTANCLPAGRPAIIVVGNDSTADARVHLRQERIDAAVQGSETVGYTFSLDPGLYATVGAPFTQVLQGIGVRKTDTALRDAIAATLQAMIDDGSYGRIMDKYNLPNNKLERAAINGEPLPR